MRRYSRRQVISAALASAAVAGGVRWLTQRADDSPLDEVQPLSSGDFINITEDCTVVDGLTIQDSAYLASIRGIDGHHFDAIQLYPPKHAYAGALLQDCIVQNCTVQGLYTLQGITAFDGLHKNLAIRDNFVEVATVHGITICGMLSGAVTGNVCNAPMRVLPLRLGGENSAWVLSFDDDNVDYESLELQQEVQDLRNTPYRSGINLYNFRYTKFQEEIRRLGAGDDPEAIQKVATYYGNES